MLGDRDKELARITWELREADILFSLAEGQNIDYIGKVAREWTVKNLVPRDLVGWCGNNLRLTRKGLLRTLEILNEMEKQKGHLSAGNVALRSKLRAIESSLPRDFVKQF
jgi:hypothetical protein